MASGIPLTWRSLLYPVRGPETTYLWEQSRLYPTKRALMPVCKEWEAITMEYMYKSLVVELFGVGNEAKLLTSLQTTKLGERLRWWVKRVDTNWKIRSTLARILRGGQPNAQ
jgi:hypothetical protein